MAKTAASQRAVVLMPACARVRAISCPPYVGAPSATTTCTSNYVNPTMLHALDLKLGPMQPVPTHLAMANHARLIRLIRQPTWSIPTEIRMFIFKRTCSSCSKDLRMHALDGSCSWITSAFEISLGPIGVLKRCMKQEAWVDPSYTADDGRSAADEVCIALQMSMLRQAA